ASDIYALGVLLYRLLTGHHPYRLESRSPREIEQAICERDPERPSTVIDRGPATEEPSTDTATTAPATTGRDRATRKLRRRLAGDLDNIVLMALHKVPEKRYGSVEQLSEDIRRHLEGLPVLARPDTLAYRSAKFVRRHRWGVTAALLLFTSLVAGIVATAWQANLARSERAAAEDVTDFLVDLFEYSRPDKTLGETITVQKLLDLGADRIERELGDQPDRRARLMDSIGFAYFKLGSYDDAEPQLEEALDLRRQIFGERHPSVAVSLNRLGELRREQGHYREAEALHRRALQMARRLRSSDRDEILADILNGLAVVLYKQERHDEAEPLLRQALDLRRSLHDEDHQETAYVLNNLALVALAREQYEEAESLSKKALEINRRLLGEDHPEVAVNLSNLAEALRAQKRCEEAIELYEETLARRIKVLGEKHPSLATTQSNLAGCLQDLDRYEEAETTYRESLNLRLETLGPEHPAVAESWNNLGRVFYDQRNFAQAEECYREALAIYRGLGQEDLQVAKNLQNLAVTLEALRELDAAEIYHRESLELNRRLLGERDPNLAVSRYRLARVLVRQGEHEEATGEFQAALDIQRESLKPQDPALAQTLTGLSFTLLETGQPERAEGLARESLSLWQQWPVEQWSKIVQSQSLLGRSLAAQGRFADAETLLLDSYSALRQQRGEADRSTQRELARVIDLYEAWDRPDEAARYRGLLTE
ncbi:MAG: tetratricopeptide repeat-containing protein kinase family protein, partial [Acidobacteriota bacterium]